jgi:L-iditol 2-dehydrogenase
MKALRVGGPGQVIWVDQAEPQVGPGEVLLQPLVCGICSSDIKTVQRGNQGGNPWALGHELVGRIIATGDGAHYPAGQRVVAAPYVPCGTCYFCLHQQPTLCQHLFDQGLDPGGLAERVRIPRPLAERGLLPVPAALSSEIAALTEPVACCVQAVEACGVAAGDTVLVVGDGPMGLINAAVARACGASRVIVAGLTPARLELAAAHYADVTIHVGQEDLTQKVRSLTDGRGADVVLVAVSSPEAALSGLSALRRGGAFNAFAGTPTGTNMPLDLHGLHYDEWRLTGSFGVAPQHLQRALDLLSSGQVDVGPLITGRFPFAEAPVAVEHMARQIGMKAVVMFESDPANPANYAGRSPAENTGCNSDSGNAGRSSVSR